MSPDVASPLVCVGGQVSVESDGLVFEQGEEARGGFALATGDSLDMLAAKACLPRKPSDSILADFAAQLFKRDDSWLLHARRIAGARRGVIVEM